MNKRSETVILVILVAAIFVGGLVAYLHLMDSNKKVVETNEMVRRLFFKTNEHTVLLKVISDKMPNTPVETRVKLADTIVSVSRVRGVPIHLVCGLIEVESGWKAEIKSPANAKGLMQVLPSTAFPYLRAERINYSDNTLFDPVVNVVVGISLLADLHQGHMEAEKEKADDYTISLHSYFWGTNNTAQLYGKTDNRVNVPNMAYPERVKTAMKVYKEMGL